MNKITSDTQVTQEIVSNTKQRTEILQWLSRSPIIRTIEDNIKQRDNYSLVEIRKDRIIKSITVKNYGYSYPDTTCIDLNIETIHEDDNHLEWPSTIDEPHYIWIPNKVMQDVTLIAIGKWIKEQAINKLTQKQKTIQTRIDELKQELSEINKIIETTQNA